MGVARSSFGQCLRAKQGGNTCTICSSWMALGRRVPNCLAGPPYQRAINPCRLAGNPKVQAGLQPASASELEALLAKVAAIARAVGIR